MFVFCIQLNFYRLCLVVVTFSHDFHHGNVRFLCDDKRCGTLIRIMCFNWFICTCLDARTRFMIFHKNHMVKQLADVSSESFLLQLTGIHLQYCRMMLIWEQHQIGGCSFIQNLFLLQFIQIFAKRLLKVEKNNKTLESNWVYKHKESYFYEFETQQIWM